MAPKRLFFWHVGLAFGMIFSGLPAQATPEDLYNGQGKRDPFVPLVTMATRKVASGLIGVQSVDEISVQGIIYDPKNGSMVIVNDSLLKEGEEEGAVKVLKVDPGGALLSVNGIEGYKAQYQSEQPKKDRA